MRGGLLRRVRAGRRGMLAAGLVLALVGTAAACTGSSKQPLTPEHCTAQTDAGAVDLDPEQARIASTILAVGIREAMPQRAVTIAYAAAYQESKLHNLDYGDRDSVGVFQQRPSQGWGPRRRLKDPAYATAQFYAALAHVDGYQQMPIHKAAQAVQRSAYGPAYQQHEQKARVLSDALTGRAGVSAFTCLLRPTAGSEVADVRAAVAHDWGVRAVTRGAGRGFHVRLGDGAPARHTRAMAFWLVARADVLSLDHVRLRDRKWRSGNDSTGWEHTLGRVPPHRVHARFLPPPSPDQP
ncbi:MAG: hypothetical protein ACRDMV_05845 [Streptosporangiales bacterium]